MNESFHLSELAKGGAFRESVRNTSFAGKLEHLDKAHALLTDALGKHGGEALTKENFRKVMETAHRDSRWNGLYSSGTELENQLAAHLGIKNAPTPE